MKKVPETTKAELIYQMDIICGESPIWDEKNHRLYWADITKGFVYTFDPVNGVHNSYNIGGPMGGMTLCEQGGLILAKSEKLYFFDPITGNIELIKDFGKDHPEHFLNDGKCDPFGRFWIGSYHSEIEKNTGILYSLEQDLSVKKRLENIILSNGLVWSLDHEKFYYIDSLTKSIYVFDYDMDSGDIFNQKVLKKIEGEIELPDGMTIDTEGFLWVAIFNSGKVQRVDPYSGETVFEVLIPGAKQVTSCTFGGNDFDELYITTAKELGGPYGIPPDELGLQNNAGGLFKIKLPFKGIPTKRFNKR